ncbi:MAG: 2'-5' RNA ligase family protein [Candidatus Heimdallarchaeaceae archaeon]
MDQVNVYKRNWSKYSKIIRESLIPPRDENHIWLGKKINERTNPPFLASIVKVDSSLWKKIQQIQSDIDRIDSRQEFFHSTYFHITLSEFGWKDQVDYNKIKQKMEDVLLDFSPFKLEIRGLNCFERIIYAQVFDKKQVLRSIYYRMLEEFPFLEKRFPEYIPHISMVRINTEEAKDVIDQVEQKYREVSIGEMLVNNVQIVSVRPYLSVGRIKTEDKMFLSD